MEGKTMPFSLRELRATSCRVLNDSSQSVGKEETHDFSHEELREFDIEFSLGAEKRREGD